MNRIVELLQILEETNQRRKSKKSLRQPKTEERNLQKAKERKRRSDRRRENLLRNGPIPTVKSERRQPEKGNLRPSRIPSPTSPPILGNRPYENTGRLFRKR